jgi:nucleotide-binding universal stress UspA family protein
MVPFHRILCPIDFSDYSLHALDHAVAIGRSCGGTVTALHVLHPIPYTDPLLGATLYTPADFDRTLSDLNAFVHGEVGHTPIETSVKEGHATHTILREATALSADLIVMGTHGRSGFERFVLGSVTERVLRKATCPVLTVPRKALDAVEAGPVVFGRILCAVDFSTVSLAVLRCAASLAGDAGTSLTVMHVVEPISVLEPVVMGGGGFPTYEEAAVAATRGRLHEIAPRGEHVREVVSVGKPYRVILDRAREEQSDVIVIGVHGGVADRIGFLGSTTNHIVRDATCPVLSLRAS